MQLTDDVLLIYPLESILNKLVNELNGLEHKIDFTYEMETNNILLFLDIMPNRTCRIWFPPGDTRRLNLI